MLSYLYLFVFIEMAKVEKGEMYVEILHRHVWLWNGKEAKARYWHLIIRREIEDHKEIKYSLSNASKETSILTLAKMQAQLYWIERSFQNANLNADWTNTKYVNG